MPVLAHIIAESGHRVHNVVCNAVPRKGPGVYPDAVRFPFQDHDFGVRTNRVEIFLGNVVAVEEYALQKESVTIPAGIARDVVRHKIQGSLFAVTRDVRAHIRVLESSAHGYVDMAVNDARHNEFAAKIGNLALIGRKARLITHIDEFAILHHKGGCQRIVLIRGKDFCVFHNHICFHACFHQPFFILHITYRCRPIHLQPWRQTRERPECAPGCMR